MKTNYYLLSLTISGIKNIEKEIRIDFYKKTIDKNFNPDNYRVKAIYGENGSGKTGIITAVKILKDLLLNDNYLNESANQIFLEENINKRTHRLHLECEFLFNDDTEYKVYRYVTELANEEGERFEIEYERLFCKIINSKNAKYETVLECENGQLLYYDSVEAVQHELKDTTANLLKRSSFAAATIRFFVNRIDHNNINMYGFYIIDLFVFGMQLVTFFENEDEHRMYLITESLKREKDDIDTLKKLSDLIKKDELNNNLTSARIKKELFWEYENKIRQLARFLQLFKTDIKNIDIEQKLDGDAYVCQLLLNYGDYRIDQEFESNGIKKLIHMFEDIKATSAGKIVFIDEMDSNINDIYLCKLVEYVMLYGKGQLCFTTHNTSPMEVLRKGKKSIDFLSNDNRIVPWTTNGNYKPENLYKQGMIQYLPFNIKAEDFIGVLGE